MPSRKKAQGRARRAKLNLKYGVFSCQHVNPSLFSSERDFDECYDLLLAFNQKINSASSEDLSTTAEHVITAAVETYTKCHEFNRSSQAVFRDMVLATATDILLHDLNKTTSDISSTETYKSAMPSVVWYVIIEAHDEHGDVSDEGEVEIQKMMWPVMRCCREYVRFVHKRNACNCLESAYNELKRTYRRTNVCQYCMEDILQNKSKCAQDAMLLCIALQSANWLITQCIWSIASGYRIQ
jgi:hypothetical protein